MEARVEAALNLSKVQEQHMSNEGMQQLEKEEKIRKAVSQVSKHVDNLQWEMDRMGTDGKSEYIKLSLQTKRLERLCR